MWRAASFTLVLAWVAGCTYNWKLADGGDGSVAADPDGPMVDDPDADEPDAGTPTAGCVRFVRPVGSTPEPDGRTWSTAFSSLAVAIEAAHQAAGPDRTCEVWVTRGTYYVYRNSRSDTILLRPGVELYGGFDSTETSREQRDWTANETVLDGHDGPDKNHQVYHVVTGSDDAVLDGFVVTGGKADGGDDIDKRGGGMLNDGASPTVRNCMFVDNSADKAGGGLYNLNSATEIVACGFVRNSAEHGGGMGNRDSAPTVTACRFIDNAAKHGGGINNTDAALTVFNSIFTGNWADDKGGAVRNNNGTDLVVINGTFAGNEAGDESGALYNRNDSNVNITNCVLWSNYAGGSPDEIKDGDHVSVRFSDVRGGFAGTGNIDADPRFSDAPGGNLRLRADSPCIDAADGQAAPQRDMDGNPRVDHPAVTNTGAGTPPYVDMGAYEARP